MAQTRHIININGKVNINYIGKLENLENDLKIILNRIGIINIIHQPFKKNSKSHNDYKTYYTNNILNKVNILMKEDFDNLDYQKIDNINFL